MAIPSASIRRAFAPHLLHCKGKSVPGGVYWGKLPPGSGRPGAVAIVTGKPTHPKPRTQSDVGKSPEPLQVVFPTVLIRHFSGRFPRPPTNVLGDYGFQHCLLFNNRLNRFTMRHIIVRSVKLKTALQNPIRWIKEINSARRG